MDDATAGRALRALRLRKGWRQKDLAAAASVSQSLVSRAERGHFGTLSIRSVRAMFAALDAGCTLTPWWRSGDLDRLLDEAHAALVARTIALLGDHGWSSRVEATFAIYAERGSIDILATNGRIKAALVVEVKSRLVSIEETLRTLDRKVRLAPTIVAEREGWRPALVGRLLVIGEGSTSRRRVAGSPVLDAAFPTRGDLVAKWLKRPVRPVSALLFVSPRTAGTPGEAIVGRDRSGRAPSCTPKPASGRRGADSVGPQSVGS